MEKFYKWIDKDGHYGMVYHEGLNVDIQPFNPKGDCEGGGLYFSREDIFAFRHCGEDLYEVEPVGEVYENPGTHKKWKAHAVDLKFVGKRSDPVVIQRLIDEGADVSIEDNRFLKQSAFWGCTEVVKMLLKAGADVNAGKGYALKWSAGRGHLEIVKMLLEAGADVNIHDGSALGSAAYWGYIEIVKVLLEAGALPTTQALYDAQTSGHTEILKLLEEVW